MAAAIEILQIKNLTMNMDIHAVKSGGRSEIVEYGERRVVFESKAAAQVGHVVLFKAEVGLGARSVKFEATGRIASATVGPNKQARFEVSFDQFDKQIWDEFRRLAHKRQSHADEILTSVSGSEE